MLFRSIVNKLLISVSYAIGVSKPVSIYVDIFEDNQDKLKLVYEIIDKFFDFSPNNIIKELNLKKPIYHKTTAYSHFGKNNLSYEKLNKVGLIKKYIDINK